MSLSDKFKKGDRGDKGDQGPKGEKGEKGIQGDRGSQGVAGVDGNSAVIMKIVQSKRHVSTRVLSEDEQIKVKELAEEACKEVYR